MGEIRLTVPFVERLGDCTDIAVTSAFANKLHETSKRSSNNLVKGERETFDFLSGVKPTHDFGNDTSSDAYISRNPSAGNVYKVGI